MEAKLLFAIGLAATQAAAAIPGFDPGRVPFSLAYKGVVSPYRVNAAFLMPGESLDIRLAAGNPGALALRFSEGMGGPSGPGAWTWRAPQSPGPRRLVLEAPGGDSVVFHAFVLVPAARQKGEYLQGYRIGRYPPPRPGTLYRPPEGFAALDSASSEIPVSPHFRLGQFRCKQPAAGGSAFLVLKEDLVLRLETVLEQANAAGHRCETLHVMSGYRTPYYNRAIGNVAYSAHQWGAAADVFVDPAGIGEMADLNGDGRRDARDAGVFFDLVDSMGCGDASPPCGGLGRYGRSSSHGPFVHVDVRPVKARW